MAIDIIGVSSFDFPISFSTVCFGVYKNAGSNKSNIMQDQGCSIFNITENSFDTYHDYRFYTYSSIVGIGY